MDDSLFTERKKQSQPHFGANAELGQFDHAEEATINPSMARFRNCMSQAIGWAQQYRDFELICFYTSFLQQLDAHNPTDPLVIAAVAINYFGTFGQYFQTAIVGIVDFLGGSTTDRELVGLMFDCRTSSPQDCEEALRKHYSCD